MKCYDGIYAIVKENYEYANESIGYHKSTFLKQVNQHPQRIDIQIYLELDEEQFFEGVFVAIFKRLPEKEERQKYVKKQDEDIKQYQKRVLKKLCNSSVVGINKIELINNPYFFQRKGFFYKLQGKMYYLTDKSFLREFGKKLPYPIQKIIRKVFL